jgi:hypothetical protein
MTLVPWQWQLVPTVSALFDPISTLPCKLASFLPRPSKTAVCSACGMANAARGILGVLFCV